MHVRVGRAGCAHLYKRGVHRKRLPAYDGDVRLDSRSASLRRRRRLARRVVGKNRHQGGSMRREMRRRRQVAALERAD